MGSRSAARADSRPPGREPVAAVLAPLLAPVVAAAGADLEAVEVTTAGRRRVLRVVVDHDDGVGLDLVAAVSHAVSDALDAGGAMGEAPYVLEVTSPGVDRPLTQPRHWRRAAGRLVTASLTAGGEVTGRVGAVDEVGVTLAVAGAARRFGFAELGPGRVQVEFRPASAQGKEAGPWTST